jgi:hypothetical protein
MTIESVNEGAGRRVATWCVAVPQVADNFMAGEKYHRLLN